MGLSIADLELAIVAINNAEPCDTHNRDSLEICQECLITVDCGLCGEGCYCTKEE